MNELFEFDGQNITINPILLSIVEFEKIWKRDKSKDKSKARKEIIFIYGMTSNAKDNIWKDYLRLKERENIIIEDLFGDTVWVPDRLVEKAIEKFKQRYSKNAAELLLETSMLSMLKVKEFLDTIDLNERDSQGRLIHNPKIILDTAKQSVKTYLDIEDVITKINNNKQLSKDRLRGGSDEGLFEDSNVMNDLI